MFSLHKKQEVSKASFNLLNVMNNNKAIFSMEMMSATEPFSLLMTISTNMTY